MLEGSKGLYLMVASTLIALIIGIILGNTLISSSTSNKLSLNNQQPLPASVPPTTIPSNPAPAAAAASDLVSSILATKSVTVNLTATIISVDPKNSTLTAKTDNNSDSVQLPVDSNVAIDTTPSHQKSNGLKAIKLNQPAFITIAPQAGSYKVMSILYPENK